MFFGEGNVYILLNVLQHLRLNYYPIKYNLTFTHFYSHVTLSIMQAPVLIQYRTTPTTGT